MGWKFSKRSEKKLTLFLLEVVLLACKQCVVYLVCGYISCLFWESLLNRVHSIGILDDGCLSMDVCACLFEREGRGELLGSVANLLCCLGCKILLDTNLTSLNFKGWCIESYSFEHFQALYRLLDFEVCIHALSACIIFQLWKASKTSF